MTTPGPHGWCRTIWSWGHPQPLMLWKEKTIAIPDQVARVLWKWQHIGTSRTSANPAAPQGILLSPPPQQYKEGDHIMETASPNLASSSYRTHSYYPLKSLALYWNLPLPTRAWTKTPSNCWPPHLESRSTTRIGRRPSPSNINTHMLPSAKTPSVLTIDKGC